MSPLTILRNTLIPTRPLALSQEKLEEVMRKEDERRKYQELKRQVFGQERNAALQAAAPRR